MTRKRLDPPKVLLDRSFLAALTDPGAAAHAAVADVYVGLVEQYRMDAALPMAITDDLDDLGIDRATRSTLLAPVRPLHPAGQHRRAARRTQGVPDDLRLTAAMFVWNRLDRIATVDPRWSAFDVPLLGPALPDVTAQPDVTAFTADTSLPDVSADTHGTAGGAAWESAQPLP